MRTALYLRVSRDDLCLDNQRQQLHAYADTHGWTTVTEFTDILTGAKGARRGLFEALASAERGEYDVLLVAAVDRLSREGMETVAGYLGRLKRAGVKFHSLREPFLSSVGMPEWVVDIILAVVASVAKAERQILIDRTNAGIQTARIRLKSGPYTRMRDGKTITTIGRPRRVKREQVQALLAARRPYREIALLTGSSVATVSRIAQGT